MMRKSSWFLSKLQDGYRFTAMTLLSSLVVLVLLNATAAAVFMVMDYFTLDPVSEKYGPSTVNTVYQGWSEGEVEALLKETWSRPYVYEPFTQFKEGPYRGSYVNVDEKGFRVTENQGPWPPQSKYLNIFLFGGSTTFGYGVPDDQTIASYLQEYLTTTMGRDVRIYNFGRGYYYSTQERILYEELLTSGFTPDMAIFIDGLNDFYFNSNEPLYTDRFRQFVSKRAKNKNYIRTKFSKTSIGRAVEGLMNRSPVPELISEEGAMDDQAEANANTGKYADAKVINSTIKRYLKNKELIEAVSDSLGVKSIFVWQPVPTYHYDQRYHPFSKGGYGQNTYSQYGYIRMSELNDENLLGDNFLWCADIQMDRKEPLYVDQVHYSSAFSKQFARSIVDLLTERDLARGVQAR